MKGTFVAAAAALLSGASAHSIHHRHADAHKIFERAAAEADEMCTTIVKTVTGECIWTPTPAVFKPSTTPAPAPVTTTAVPVISASPAPLKNTTTYVVPTYTPPAAVDTTVVVPSVEVPTPVVSTCTVPGTYTFPATTVVITETTTVCGASTTSVPAGTHTLGGVTTVVATETTVVCPYATSSTMSNGVVTSILQSTTYVCPSAGTYTIAPITTVCTVDTVVVVPVVTSYVPATYTRPAVVTTVTETDVVIVCPFAAPTTSTVVPAVTPSTKAASTTSTSAPVVPATTQVVETTTSAAAVPTTTVPAVVVATTSSTSVAKVATTSTSSSAASTGTSPAILGGGDQWAITYTPYTTSGQCKGASAVLTDIQEIKSKGFNTVRVYSTDCDTLENVGSACEKTGIKMIIGVFISEVGCGSSNPDVASQISSIKAWAKWDLVELVVVGNEAGNQGFCTPSELKSLIVEVQTIIKDCGASVPVTTTDTVNVWQNEEFSSALCPIVDVVACNAHAYFNAETTPSGAGAFVSGQLDIVKKICGKEGYVLETGWPSSCVANGVATCSAEDQATAISSLRSALGGSVVFFSYSNDDWKDNGACECEQHWGIGQLFSS